jgi:hypothetical protein
VEAPAEPIGYLVASDSGDRIHYLDWGGTATPGVVLVHGLWGSGPTNVLVVGSDGAGPVVFHFDGTEELRARLGDVVLCPESDAAAFARLLPEMEVLWHVLKPVTAEVIARAPKLKLIQKIGSGVNTIDVEAAKKRGIAVCNLPGSNSRVCGFARNAGAGELTYWLGQLRAHTTWERIQLTILASPEAFTA